MTMTSVGTYIIIRSKKAAREEAENGPQWRNLFQRETEIIYPPNIKYEEEAATMNEEKSKVSFDAKNHGIGLNIIISSSNNINIMFGLIILQIESRSKERDRSSGYVRMLMSERSRGCGFESRLRILDGSFSRCICCKIVVMFEKDQQKRNQKVWRFTTTARPAIWVKQPSWLFEREPN